MVMKHPARKFGPVQYQGKKTNKRGRPRTHPWDTWFATDTAEQPLTLTKGVHFHCQLLGMAQQFRSRSMERGIRVYINTINDDTLLIRFSRL